jgi:hypothetical protein
MTSIETNINYWKSLEINENHTKSMQINRNQLLVPQNVFGSFLDVIVAGATSVIIWL